MTFHLHSRDEDSKSGGKTSSGYTVTYKLVADPDNWQTITIDGETSERFGDGSRGGKPRIIKRSIHIRLFKEDLERIFEAAFSCGLFTPDRVAKATEALRTALSHLERDKVE
jgi:hypothetical protein